MSSRSFTLKRGWCFLIRWFSRSSASFSAVTTIVSTSADGAAEKARRDEEPLVAAVAEVLAHARAQVLRLADVDDLPARVLEQVDAGLGRDPIEDLGGDHG